MHEGLLKTLQEVGAIITGSHVVYTSGKHGSGYVNKDALYPHTSEVKDVGYSIARAFQNDAVDVVVGPVIGGVILSQWTANQLAVIRRAQHGYDKARQVFAVYAEKDQVPNAPLGTHCFVFKRGYDKLVQDKNVLVVEDVLTTGDSAKKVVDLVRTIGGNVVGVGALCNRGGVTAEDLGVPKLVSLVHIALEAWDEQECPLCAKSVPINTSVGKGREFLAKKHQLA